MSVHVYEKRSSERVGRVGKRREAIAELLKTGVSKLEQYHNAWLLHVVHTAVENTECLVFVSERVIGTLSTIISSQHGGRDFGKGRFPPQKKIIELSYSVPPPSTTTIFQLKMFQHFLKSWRKGPPLNGKFFFLFWEETFPKYLFTSSILYSF